MFNYTRIARGAERPPEGQVFWRSERNTPPNFVTLQRCSETMGIALSLMQLLPVLTWILQCALFYDRKPHLQVPDLSRFFREFTTPPSTSPPIAPSPFLLTISEGGSRKIRKIRRHPAGKANPLSTHRSQVQDHPPSPIDLWL